MDLKDLNQVAGRIFHQYLIPSDPLDDFVPEGCAGGFQPFNLGRQVGDLDLESIPAARFWHGPVGHRRASSSLSARSAQHQPEIPSLQDGERRSRVHHHLETQELAIETNRLVDILNDVSHANWHKATLSLGKNPSYEFPGRARVRAGAYECQSRGSSD
jgi:hypothetical protein